MQSTNDILPLDRQAQVRDEWLELRLHTVLPPLMQETGIDMWIVLARECNEDPVLPSLLPATMLGASRLTGLIFWLNAAGEVEAYSLNTGREGPLGKFYTPLWNKDRESRWECLSRFVQEKRPKRIGINRSQKSAFADGLSAHLYEKLLESLEGVRTETIVSAEELVIAWLERRSDKELQIYPAINRIAHMIIDQAFSLEAVNPGVTTTTELEWWMMEKVTSLGLRPWFHFDVDLQRRGTREKRRTEEVIQPGDLLHCDIGLEYLGLKTDTQRLAYVLRLGETGIPEGLRRAMKTANRFQDIVCLNFIQGKSGNEILTASLAQAEAENIKAQLYTHPIGYHGHGAGPVIGLWDNQEYVPDSGDNTLCSDTCYALELNITQAVPEWDGQQVTIFLEQTVAFTGGEVHYLDGRQTEIIPIG
jgi:methionine aminopeptidase